MKNRGERMKTIRIYILSLAIILLTLFLIGCNNNQLPTPSITDNSSSIISEENEQKPETNPEQFEPQIEQGFLEVVYFHNPQRCVTCLCFEERITHVVNTYFSNEINSGKLKYLIINVGNKDNAQIIDKYGAYGSQLFINKVIGNKDNMTDIVEIWDWKCRSDKPGFDAKIKNLIEQSLAEINS